LGAALALLFVAFPSGVTDATKTLYLGELRRLGFAPAVVAEAAQRILHTREQRTVPPIAQILRTCREVQGERSQSASGPRTCSMGEARDLAVRRLKLQAQPLDEENIQAELGRMESMDVVKIEGAA